MRQDDSLLDLLVEVKPKRVTLTPAEMAGYVARTRDSGRGVVGELVCEGILSEDDVAKARARYFTTEFVDLDSVVVPEDVIGLINGEIARRFNAMPVSVTGNCIRVAFTDPSNLDAIDGLAHILKLQVVAVVATQRAIECALSKYYPPRLTGIKLNPPKLF
ncbi:MAG: hypothetical protein EXS59_00185 [Candidatus Taylorbacteria bacterium]|nr:hypothetical protein [Candidatus Taylorbacteria bacterium]